MDFTHKKHILLIKTLLRQGFLFQTFVDFTPNPHKRVIILRHDVDRMPKNSLKFGIIQAEEGINSTYYFRVVQESFDEQVITEIVRLGHEIGYHYEDVSLAADRLKAVGGRQKGISKKYEVGSKEYEEYEKKLVDIAFESFSRNLEKLRGIVPVKTICMHGSPLSKWDSRLLWKYYDYHDFGIIREPYFDIDFNNVLYLTDTGRRWDGESVSVRDKAVGGRLKAEGENPYEDWKIKPVKYRDRIRDPGPRTQDPGTSLRFHSTSDIIKAAEEGRLPDNIMMTFHPQRWTDKPVPWVRELVWQNVKNVAKYFIVKVNSEK